MVAQDIKPKAIQSYVIYEHLSTPNVPLRKRSFALGGESLK